jgi:malonyl CoA-acyl carrier protein transacylase
MAKKSHKRAAKYSQQSKAKQRRRKQLDRSSTEATAVVTPIKEEMAEASQNQKIAQTAPKKSPPTKMISKVQPGGKQAIPDYRYVRDDLKRIGILTGAVIVILIILAFVLG